MHNISFKETFEPFWISQHNNSLVIEGLNDNILKCLIGTLEGAHKTIYPHE